MLGAGVLLLCGANGQDASRRDCCRNERLKNGQVLQNESCMHCSRSFWQCCAAHGLGAKARLSTPPGALKSGATDQKASVPKSARLQNSKPVLRLVELDCVALDSPLIGVASCANIQLSETFASPSTSRARFRAPLVA